MCTDCSGTYNGVTDITMTAQEPICDVIPVVSVFYSVSHPTAVQFPTSEEYLNLREGQVDSKQLKNFS